MKTLAQLLRELQSDSAQPASIDPTLAQLIGDVAAACRQISHLVRQGEIAGVLGSADTDNVQGETQKKLDIISNDVFIDATQWGGTLAGIASEEMDHMYAIPTEFRQGPYLVTVDPLDGSSNIDVNGAVGTIFSILKAPTDAPATDQSFLQPGTEQVCAGYCLYSSATQWVMTTGQGVHGFTLDGMTGEFVLTHPDMTIPEQTREFAINAAYARHWMLPVKRYIDELVQGADGARGDNFNMRWAGSMVGDVHRILCRGGIFLYPDDVKLRASGKAGKLRLLYEANPMAWIVEQASGLATTGHERILNIQPESLHQRVPVILGSREEVQRCMDYHTAQNE